MSTTKPETLYSILKKGKHEYSPDKVAELLKLVDEERVKKLSEALTTHIGATLPTTINRRKSIHDYKMNPYVLLTSASVMGLGDPGEFASFLFNNKFYMGLETSFGKSIESAFVGQYPINTKTKSKWEDPKEKLEEFAALSGLSNEEKALARTNSVWREIDKSSIVGNRRYLVSIKSGPNCINDTQVAGMTRAILDNHPAWLSQTIANYPGVDALDVVVGLTYGTEQTTNNKENQILAKLQTQGFTEEDRKNKPGVLIDPTGKVRAYRVIGQGFWSFIGDPSGQQPTEHIFLEALLSLARGLSLGKEQLSLEERVNFKLLELSEALKGMLFPKGSLPEWIKEDFNEDELFWLAAALSAFFDKTPSKPTA